MSMQNFEHFDDRELSEHVETYRDFLRVLRWSVGVIAIILIGLAAWGG